MDMPITRAAAYYKRNRTTHSWYGDQSDLMSKSCPDTRTLEDHMRMARAAVGISSYPRHRASDTSPRHRAVQSSPRHRAATSAPIVIRAKGATMAPSSSSSSPGPTTTAMGWPRSQGGQLERPTSAYSYDGGMFISANNAQKDFFVINPEWVSEDETVKKLSSDTTDGAVASSIRTGRWPRRVVTWNSYRKSKSAPPPKYRNPITWK